MWNQDTHKSKIIFQKNTEYKKPKWTFLQKIKSYKRI